MCAFIELWRRDLRTTCPSGLRAGAQPAQLPQSRRVFGSGGSLRNGAFRRTCNAGQQPAERPQTKRQRSCGPSHLGGCGPRGSKSRKFSLQYHPPASVAASPAQQSPAKKRSQPAEQNITKGVTHCLAPVLADCDRNHACGNGPLRHRCSARTSFGLVMRIVGKIRENSSANAKRLLRHCVPHAITGRCAGRNRSEKRFMPLGSDLSQAGRRRFGSVLRAIFGDGDRSSGRNRQGMKKSGAGSISYRGHWDTRNQSIVRALAAPSRTGQGLTRTDNFHT